MRDVCVLGTAYGVHMCVVCVYVWCIAGVGMPIFDYAETPLLASPCAVGGLWSLGCPALCIFLFFLLLKGDWSGMPM